MNYEPLILLIFQFYFSSCDPQWSIPLYKTKTPRYKLRGSLHTPTESENYCRKGLCPPGVEHLACNKPFWGKNCPMPREGVNVERHQNVILDYHNNLRQRLLMAPLKDLPVANKLPPLRWDSNLCVLAMRVTNYCNDPNATECINTPQYLDVGHGLFTHKLESNLLKGALFIKFAVQNIWAYQATRVNRSFVESFPENPQPMDVEFANMINQKVNRVGCGMLSRPKANGLEIRYFCCLYNSKIKPGDRVYDPKPDPPAHNN